MMTGSNGDSFPANLPILDGKNYEKRCIQMWMIFGFQEVLEIVNRGIQELAENATYAQRLAYKDSKKKDCKALFLIHQCVDSGNFEKISSANSDKEARDTLHKAYEGANKVKKVRLQSLRRQYELLSMEDQETTAAYFSRIQTLVNLVKTCGQKITEQMMVDKVLRTLTPRFDHIEVAIEESKNLEELKVEELQSSLNAHEQRLNERNKDKAPEKALQAHSNRRYDGESSKYKKGK